MASALSKADGFQSDHDPFAVLYADMDTVGTNPSATDWTRITSHLRAARFHRGDFIFNQREVGNRWLFLTDGIAASQQTHSDGSHSIARFFEPPQFCGNLTSTWSNTLASDDLIAISHVSAIIIPHHYFKAQYFEGGEFGQYLRHKVIETLCFDKDLISAKTNPETEARYQFLEQRHAHVLSTAKQKHIAAFMGITPQSLSRFLRRRARPII